MAQWWEISDCRTEWNACRAPAGCICNTWSENRWYRWRAKAFPDDKHAAAQLHHCAISQPYHRVSTNIDNFTVQHTVPERASPIPPPFRVRPPKEKASAYPQNPRGILPWHTVFSYSMRKMEVCAGEVWTGARDRPLKVVRWQIPGRSAESYIIPGLLLSARARSQTKKHILTQKNFPGVPRPPAFVRKQ